MLYYMELEPYEARYTLQLTKWTEDRYKELNIPYKVIHGKKLTQDKDIKVGQVLDAHGRSYFSLTQIASLIEHLPEMTSEDVIFFEDMFTPGIESLPYIFDQLPKEKRPRVFVRCLAQTIDPDDFVHVTGMYPWMSLYEKMLCEFVDGILCTNEEMVAYAKVAGWKKLYNIGGLTFGKKEVQDRSPYIPFSDKKRQVVFASRLDQEKRPDFLIKVAQYLKHYNIPVVVCCGGEAKCNNKELYKQLKTAFDNSTLILRDRLKKDEYYEILANSRVLFNCSLQDWTSNTVSEADALGCNTVFPAYRSFPEVFRNNEEKMYVPWSVTSAVEKIINAMQKPIAVGCVSEWNNKTVDRYLDLIYTNPLRYDRNSLEYRTKIDGIF